MLAKHFHTVCLDRAAEFRNRSQDVSRPAIWRRDDIHLARLWVKKSRAIREARHA